MSSIVVFETPYRAMTLSAAAKIFPLPSAASVLRTLLLVWRPVLPRWARPWDAPDCDGTPASGRASPGTGKPLADVTIFLPDRPFGDLAAGQPGQRFRPQHHIPRDLVV